MTGLKAKSIIKVRCVRRGSQYGVSFEMKNRKDEAAIDEAKRLLKKGKVKDPEIYNFEITRAFQLSKVKSNGVNKKR